MDYQRGVRARDLVLDLKWIAKVASAQGRKDYLPGPRRRDAVGAFLSLFDPRIRDDVLSLSDPLPGLTQLADAFRGLLRRAG